jgi:hypothetical protein
MSRMPRSHRGNFLLFGAASALAATAIANNVMPSSMLIGSDNQASSCGMSLVGKYCLQA